MGKEYLCNIIVTVYVFEKCKALRKCTAAYSTKFTVGEECIAMKLMVKKL